MDKATSDKTTSDKTTKKKDFVWSDDEAELILSVTHDYKVQCLTEGTCWESVKTKYSDILELFRKELPSNEEEQRNSFKDYRHKPDDVTKDIITTKLKAVRGKFRQVLDTIIIVIVYHCILNRL